MAHRPSMMMISACALFVGLLSTLRVIAVVGEAANPHPHPQELEHQLLLLEASDSGLLKGCSYRVRIKTSCRSPRLTRDVVALSFGDAYNNQVYVPRLDDPWSKTFEHCSTDTFDIAGPCGYGVCYLLLWRDGPDGWIPDWVEVYDPYYARYVTFYYGSPIPPRVWYGFNHCTHHVSNNDTTSTTSTTATTATTGVALAVKPEILERMRPPRSLGDRKSLNPSKGSNNYKVS